MATNDPKHQGKFHLLAIILIPLMAVSLFLAPWYVPLIIALAAVLSLYLIFRK